MTGGQYRAKLITEKKQLNFQGRNVEDLSRNELLIAVYAYQAERERARVQYAEDLRLARTFSHESLFGKIFGL